MSAAPALAPRKLNPFPGLRPFTQDEDYLFFGREEQTLELLQRLGSQRFVAVVGSSGSGKSSLVRCGLLSELLGGRMLEAGAAWEIAVTHPGGNPLALLTDALLDADLYDREAEHARENLLATLSRSHFGLVEAVKQAGIGEDTNFLLVVDQFEEIFRFHEAGQKQQEAANEFVSLLLEAASQKDVAIYVVLTMRSDFIGECGQFEGLAEMVNRGEFLIPRLTREQYKRVIEGPIKVAGGQIAPRLLQRLLNDLGQQADQLPCLQHALMRTWDVWAAKGDVDALDLDDYQCVGKMTQALSLHADEVYASLASDRQRELCRGMFQALTVEESNSRGIRRPQRLGRLCQILEVPAEELQPIVDAYRQSGVTFLMPSPEVALTDQTIIDISHESLMRVWTRLRQWVEEETQAAGIYHRLSESADLHEQGKAGLYRDPELGIALAWRESKRPNIAWAERYRPGFPMAMEFLEASRQASVLEEQAQEAARQHELEQAQQLAEAQKLRLEQQQRSARNLRKLVAGVAGVAVIAAIACVVALFARHDATRMANLAAEQALNAKNNETQARQSQQETVKALAIVASQKKDVDSSLTKAKSAERQARAAEEAGRKLLYTTDMKLAPFVWRDDRTTAEQLRVLLAKHVPANNADGKSDLRGFEWHYYHHLLERSATIFPGSEVPFVSAAFGPQGQPVTFDENGQVRRWNLSSQDEDRPARRDIAAAANAQVRVLSPDGKLVALVAGNDILVFDTATGQQAFQVKSTPIFRNRLVAFSGDGTRMVVADDKVRWCLCATGQVTATLDKNFDRIESVVLSANGLLLAVVGHSSTGNTVSTYRLDATGRTVTPQTENINLGGTMGSSALSPDGKRLAVGAALAGSLFVLDPATGRVLAYLSAAHASRSAAVAFSPDSTRLATADAEGTIKIWNDAQKLNSRSTASLTLKGHQGAITSVAFSQDGRRLITTSADKTARVWDLENAGAAIQRLEVASNADALDVDYSPDGQLIAAALPTSGTVRLWDAGTGDAVRELTFAQPTTAFSVAFSPTDSRLLAVGSATDVILWDIDTGTELARLPGTSDLPGFVPNANNSPVTALAFSPDGKYLVAGFGSKNMLMAIAAPSPLKVWDVATRKLIRRLNGHNGYCVSLDFSRDGTLMASGSRDGTAILWSTRTWKSAHTLTNPDFDSVFEEVGRPGMVEAVAFSPDGKVLAQGSRERSIHLWNTGTGALLDTLKGHSAAVAALVFAPDGRTLASSSQDQTVRLWNVETRGELMQLDSGNVRLGSVQALAFSPDGQKLLAGGDGRAFWSAAPLVWNDPDRAAGVLKALLGTSADFRSRVRMLSENLRLHSALEKLDAGDPRVAAGLAATQANWHASRGQWPEAAAAFDRLVAADPQAPQDWLRTPGLLRLATALMYQDRPREAAALLTGGARRRSAEGLATVVDRIGIGMTFSVVDTQVVISGVSPRSPADKAGLRSGDIIEKVNTTDLTVESYANFLKMLEGAAGSKVRLTVRRSGVETPQVIEVTRERFLNDVATGDVLLPLRAALDERLKQAPRHPGLLELRAELTGHWSGYTGQVIDYTAAIDALTQDAPDAAAADLQRLYARRGDAHASLKQWQEAVDDYTRGITDATTDNDLLTRQAQAQAELLLSASRWTVLKPVEATAKKGTTLAILPDDSVLASGDTPLDESYRIETVVGADFSLAAVRLEALTHDSLPRKGPGRTSTGTFSQRSLKVTATTPDGAAPVTLRFQEGWSDQTLRFPIKSGGEWNTADAPNVNTTAIWRLDTPVALAAGTRLTFETEYKPWQGKGENAGRMRWSLSSDLAAIDHERLFLAASKVTDPWQRLAAACRTREDVTAIDQLVARHPKHLGQIGDAFVLEEAHDRARAVEIYSRGITPDSADVTLLSKRGRAYEALQNWEAAAADWSRAAAGNPDGSSLLAEFGRRLAAASQFPLAIPQFERALALDEATLQADPENDAAASALAEVLVNMNEAQTSGNWTVLQPETMTSEGRAQLEQQPGGSILVRGTLAIDRDTYTIVVPAPDKPITGLRLDVIPHVSLPLGGSGRATTNGNFALSEFTTVVIPRSGEAELPIDWAEAVSDHETPADRHYNRKSIHIRNVIDGDTETYWESWPELRVPHRAFFFPKAAVSSAAGDKLKFTLKFGPVLRHGLGHFRLSVSNDPANLERGTRREQEANRTAVTKLTDPWLKLAAAYALTGRPAQASQVLNKVLERAGDYEKRKPILEIASRLHGLLTPVVQSQPNDLQLQLALARHHAARGQRSLEGQRPQDALTELQASRDVYARLRAAAPESNWRVLKPTSVTSPGGEVFTVEVDGSIFVSGPRPHRAVYTLTLPSELPAVSAIRLDTIPDPRLPGTGAGRYGNGNFHLAEFTAATEAGGKPLPLAFSAALTDASTTVRYDAAKIIDRDPRTYWDILPQSKQPHTAVFVLKSPAKLDGRPLRVTVDSGITSWGQHGLGRFRISVTAESDPQALAALRMDVKASEVADVHVALAKGHSQQGNLDEAVSRVREALDFATDRADRSRVLTEAAGLAGVLEALAERTSRQPSADQQTQLALAREFSARGQRRLSESLPADAQADLERALAVFGPLRTGPQWTVLTPSESTSTGGETLSVGYDGSVYVRGPNPDRAEYTLKFKTDLPVLTALRVEALPDPRLPTAGAGRFSNGNFTVAELSAHFASGNAEGRPTRLEFGLAVADHQQDDSGPLNLFDGDVRTHWNTYPQVQKPHRLVATFKTPVRAKGGVLSITLDSGTAWPKHGLGRFRVSATGDAGAVENERLRNELSDGEILDLRLALAKAQARQGRAGDAAATLAAALEPADRDVRIRVITEAAKLEGVLEMLAERAAGNALFQAELARHFAEQNEVERAQSVRLKARGLLEQQLQAEPRNTQLASELSNLLQSSVPELEYVWIDDDTPAGANLQGDTPWEWVGPPDHPVFRGQKAMRRKSSERSQHFFDGAASGVKTGYGARLFAYVYLDPKDTPKTLMMQFYADGWDHRAIWGEDLIPWGTAGTVGHVLMGPLPKTGEWVRLEVDAAKVGVAVGSELKGWGFSQHGGTCYWDAAGWTQTFDSPWQQLFAAYRHLGETERGLGLLANGLDPGEVAAGLPAMLLTDEVLDVATVREPEFYAAVLPGSATAALERGEMDLARRLYTRLSALQPESPLWRERGAQLGPDVLGVWNFDAGPGSWGSANRCMLAAQDGILTVRTTGSDPHFQAAAVGPAGRKGVVLRYRTDQDFTLQIFWADATGDFDESHHHDYAVPASTGEWREMTLPFWCEGALKMLRLDPNTDADHPLEIDSLVVRQLEPAEYRRAATELLVEPELARLTAALTAASSSATYSARAQYWLRIGRWREAAEDFAQDRALRPKDRIAWFKEAVARLHANDVEGYSAVCRAMAEQFRGTIDAGVADSLCKACLLRPETLPVAELPISIVQAAALDLGDDREWMLACSALIAYRQGFFEEAAGWSRKVANNKYQPGALALLVRAMAEHRLGQPDARQTLSQAEALFPTDLRSLGTPDAAGPLPAPPAHIDHDWLAAELLRREAEALLNGTSPDPAKPTALPQ